MSRVCIYLSYDKQNIVDNYIGYMLKELKANVDYLIVVYNGLHVVRGQEILEAYADAVVLRENVGYDAGGFQDVLCDKIGWDIISTFDELVLVNDSFFGPLFPLCDIFEEMGKRNVDFWGISKHAEVKVDDVYLPEHIQTFFLVINKKMLNSNEFVQYWEKLPIFLSFNDVVMQHEIKFTQYFADRGYTYDTWCDLTCNDSVNPINNFCQYLRISCELIKKRKFPFVKKKSLMAYDVFSAQGRENEKEIIQYIDEHTGYDIDLIYENMIRISDMSDLYKVLGLHYTVSSEKVRNENTECAIVVFVRFKNACDYIEEYIERISERKKYIFASTKELAEFYSTRLSKWNVQVEIETLELWKIICQNKYICVVHDVDFSSDCSPNYINKSCFYSVWSNLIKNDNYIANILTLFDKEKRLGFLAPQTPIFGRYFGQIGKGWGNNFEEVEKDMLALKLKCRGSFDKPPFVTTNNYWIRGDILNNLVKVNWKPSEITESLWIYIAQSAGYYSGIVQSVEYSALNTILQHEYLENIISISKKQGCSFDTFLEYRMASEHTRLKMFCEKYEDIYIYGFGYLAHQYMNMITNLRGFIVSDGHKNKETLLGYKISQLSDIVVSSSCGVVLCMNEENQRQVIPLLRKRGINDFFCV